MSPSDKRHPLRILVVVAHPHDFTHMAGTCGKHVDMGDSVTVVSVTGGANIHNEPLELELRKPVAERNMDIINESAEVYAGRKKHEMHKAAALFGITDVRVLPYMDNPIEVTRALEAELAGIVYEIRPHMLLTQDPYGVADRGHANMTQDDHRDVGIAVQRALAIAGTPDAKTQQKPHRIAVTYYTGVSLSFHDWDMIVDVSDHAENRLKAEMMFLSQGSTEAFANKRIEMSLALPGWTGGCGFGEAFIRARPQINGHLPVTEIELTQAEQPSMERMAAMAKRLCDVESK